MLQFEKWGMRFESGVTGLQWVIDAYTIVFASLIPAAGVLADRIGARRVFIAGFAIFTLVSMVCAAAPNLLALIVARGVQGVGAAALVPCSLALLVAPMATAVLGAVERTQSGIGLGALNATRQAGSVIGVALYGSLIADQGQFTRGTHIALYLSTALLVLGFGVALRYVSVGNRVGIAKQAAGPIVSR